MDPNGAGFLNHQQYVSLPDCQVFFLKKYVTGQHEKQKNMKHCHSTVVLDIAQKTNHLNVSVGMIRNYTHYAWGLEDLQFLADCLDWFSSRLSLTFLRGSACSSSEKKDGM